MKLTLQIFLGVFLGSLAAQFTFDSWRVHRETLLKAAAEQRQAELDRVRTEQAERIRALLQKSQQGHVPEASKPPPDFVPDDAQQP